jgi:hypothetical protein
VSHQVFFEFFFTFFSSKKRSRRTIFFWIEKKPRLIAITPGEIVALATNLRLALNPKPSNETGSSHTNLTSTHRKTRIQNGATMSSPLPPSTPYICSHVCMGMCVCMHVCVVVCVCVFVCTRTHTNSHTHTTTHQVMCVDIDMYLRCI